MHPIQIWTLAARPKTLIASISPVLIGSVLAVSTHAFDLALFLFTLATAIGIQITTNLANDYFDFVKGADTSNRKGFLRVTQAGLVSLNQMKRGLTCCALITCLCGCYLIWKGGLLIAILFSISLLLAFLYTAGPYPLAYLGLGEGFVFVFFGPVAVLGTYFLQIHLFSLRAFLVGIIPGALSTAILIINNIRDEHEDRFANKKTLVVRFGKSFGKLEYFACMILSYTPLFFFISSHPFVLLSLFTLPLSLHLCYILHKNTNPYELNSLFAKTGQLLWLHSLLFCIGWML